MSPFILIALALWLAPAMILGSGLTLIAVRAEAVDLAQWRRCAADNPNDPASKTCWVHVSAGLYCPRHDGSGSSLFSS